MASPRLLRAACMRIPTMGHICGVTYIDNEPRDLAEALPA